MPNYIKNRIELIGSENLVNALIEKFGTHHEEKQHKSYDGDDTYQDDDGRIGWLNTEKNIFRRRNTEDVIGVPDGFKPHTIKPFFQFPDFNRIIPMPESLHISSDSWLMPLEHRNHNVGFKKHIDEFKEYIKEFSDKGEEVENFIAGIKNYIQHGHATWYSWSIENWGTEWNSSECQKILTNTFDFITAWSGVPNLIQKMSNEFPDVKIIYQYSSEDTGYNCGIGTYFKGKSDFIELENSSNEAYELAFNLRPENREYYQIIDGKFQYIDEDE